MNNARVNELIHWYKSKYNNKYEYKNYHTFSKLDTEVFENEND